MAGPGQPVGVDPSVPPSDGSCKITKLPSEVHQNIFENITNQAHLLNLMTTCKDLKAPAEAILWRVCTTRGYEKLLSMPSDEQLYYKTKVHTLMLDFQDNGLQPGHLELHLPCLRILAILYSSQGILDVQVNVSNLITSSLRHLRIVNGSTDNFVPALRQAKDLETLSLAPCVEVDGADPLSFLSLIRTMPRLSTLDASVLASSELLVEVAGRNLMALNLRRAPISLSQVSRALQIPQPFSRLEDLCTMMQASAATLLLRNLPRLKQLTLEITTALSTGETYTPAVIELIKVVSAKTELSVLWLNFGNIRMTIDIKHFAPLKNLVNLDHFGFVHQFDVRYRVTDDRQPFSSLCPLRVLFIDTQNTAIGNYFDRIATNHPNLEEMVYRRPFNLNQMSVQFPSLWSMGVSSTNIVLTDSNADTGIRTLAAKLISIAPKLKRFRAGQAGAFHTEIHFEHRQNSIFCTCRHQWNDNVTFTI